MKFFVPNEPIMNADMIWIAGLPVQDVTHPWTDNDDDE